MAEEGEHHVSAVNGTYGPGCTDRSGRWSLPVGDSTAPLNHPPLSVVPNDADCALTLTDLVANWGPDEAMLRNPKFDPPIPLSDSWAKTPSRLVMDGATAFSNAKLETSTFANDFAISLTLGPDPSLHVSTVPAPDYASNMNGLEITVDAAGIVDSVAGNVALSNASHGGDHYAIDHRWLQGSAATWSVELLREAYDLAEERTLEGPEPHIPADAFGLIGEDLSSGVARTIIVSRTEHGVRSFQALRVTFRAPGG